MLTIKLPLEKSRSRWAPGTGVSISRLIKCAAGLSPRILQELADILLPSTGRLPPRFSIASLWDGLRELPSWPFKRHRVPRTYFSYAFVLFVCLIFKISFLSSRFIKISIRTCTWNWRRVVFRNNSVAECIVRFRESSIAIGGWLSALSWRKHVLRTNAFDMRASDAKFQLCTSSTIAGDFIDERSKIKGPRKLSIHRLDRDNCEIPIWREERGWRYCKYTVQYFWRV